MNKIKSGYAAILGLPNSGKSTLLNSLLGQKLSITNPKPQTTRKRILGILSGENYQVIFLDTPGILKPSYLLQKKMMEFVELSVKDADVILLMLDTDDDPEGIKTFEIEFIDILLKNNKRPKLLLLNKVDLIQQQRVMELIKKFESTGYFEKVIPVSALLNFNTQTVLEELINLLPEGPKYYPDDIVADESERFFVSELIREKILEYYKEEIPYSTEVIIADFKERETGKDFIQAEIIVEKDTQKIIIIGKEGKAIKRLGEAARKDIEQFLQREVFLELRVKVRKKWRSDEKILTRLGYSKEK